MGIIIDLIVLAILAVSTFIGYKRGLIKVAVKILAFFIAIIIAIVAYKPIANLIMERTEIDDKIETSIISKLDIQKEEEKEEENNSKKQEINVVELLIDSDAAQNTIASIAESVTIKIIQIASLIIVFIVARILLIVVSLLTDLIAKIPGIKQVDKAGGTIYGFLKGALIILLLLAIISISLPLIPENTEEILNTTILTKILLNNNPLFKLF